jgi:hypothetical protein
VVVPGSDPSPTGRVQVSHVVTDPVWCLRPWSVDVRLGSLRATIPAMPAADWLAVLMSPDLTAWDIIPGLCPGMEDQLDSAMLAGTVEYRQVHDTALEVVATVGARPWWFTLRLLSVMSASWESVGGELALSGVDAATMALGAWLDAALLTCLRGVDPKDVTMFMSRLEAPPAGEEVAEPEMSRAAFLALG